MRTAAISALVLAALICVAPVIADVTPNPDANTLWIEDFAPFESAADSRAGWFAFEPAEISAEQADDTVRFREISRYAGGSIQRILPLGNHEYGYLQIRITRVENPDHWFKAWLWLPAEGNPQLGRMDEGINTVNLGRIPCFDKIDEIPLDLAVIGPGGSTPSGAVDVDWVRLVKQPLGGLTVELEQGGEVNGLAEIGDTLVFTYVPERPVEGQIAVTCRLTGNDSAIRLSEDEQILLTPDGQGTFSARVTIAPEATELASKAGSVMATAQVGGEARNAPMPFGFSILPAPWRAEHAAGSLVIGEEVFSEDFSTSDAHNWRTWSEGWTVHRPEADGGEPAGLRNRTYKGPKQEDHWIALPTAPMEDASISAGIRPLGGSGPMMLALRFHDPDNHCRLRIEGSTELMIDRVRAGWQEVLARTTLPESIRKSDDEPATVATFTVAGSTLIASIDGRPVLHAYDNSLTTGGAALGLNRINGQFDHVALRSAEVEETSEDFPWSGLRMQIGLRERDRAFGRDAGGISVPATIENATAHAMGPFTVSATLIRQSLYTDPVAEVQVPEIAAGGSSDVRVTLDPIRYRSGDYTLVFRLRAGRETVATDATQIVIGRAVPDERMDVMWWGSANIPRQLRQVAKAGVNVLHEASQRTPELRAIGTRLGLTYYSYIPSLRSKSPARLKDGFHNPHASSNATRLDETDPEVREWALTTARDHARRWRDDPRMEYVLLNSEYENHSYPNLSDEAEARYEKMLGFPRPEQATRPFVPPSESLALFPGRIIPDDSELYGWFRFFYAGGGGALNGLTCQQSREINRVAPHITTFHDPVLRGPQFHGRWEGMEMLNHWTYVERNPLDVAAFADELVRLGQANDWQMKISQMIQVIAYADRAMPGRGSDAPAYLRDAPFVAIPPDILTEAVWLVMSRPVDMIAFHGFQTAIETQEQDNYRYTNPHTLTALGRVTEELIEPYGPALRRIKKRHGPRIALLLSAVNTVFGRIPEGGGTRSLHNPLTAARFGVDVLYDHDVKNGALEEYSVLAIPQCRFMLQSVRERIDEFQRAGGTVLLDGDAEIDIPDAIILEEISSEAASDQQLELVPGEVLELADSPRARLDADLRMAAAALREQIIPRLDRKPFVDSAHPWVVLDARHSGELSYIFAINDRRQAGPYLGQFGAVLERGVPIETEIELRDTPGAIYDALAGVQLNPAETEDGGCSLPVTLEPGWGTLLIAADEPLGSPAVSVSDSTKDSGPVDVQVQARYSSGRGVKGVVPVHFEVRSADGAVNDFSRFSATDEEGNWSTSIPIADNEPAGLWTVRITELIGGHSTVASFTVEGVPPGERLIGPAPDLKPLALWNFDPPEETQDELGGSYRAELRGQSRFVEDGKSGGCLECFTSVNDSSEGMEIARDQKLSPTGRFSTELWLKPKPEMVDAETTMLIDCNYYFNTRDIDRANTGYAFFLKRQADELRPRVILGLGNRTVSYTGQPVNPQAGTWHHLGFVYDGAGRVTIYFDGREIGGGMKADAGPVAPSAHPLIIGGRVGSSHFGCAGFIDDVRLAGE